MKWKTECTTSVGGRKKRDERKKKEKPGGFMHSTPMAKDSIAGIKQVHQPVGSGRNSTAGWKEKKEERKKKEKPVGGSTHRMLVVEGQRRRCRTAGSGR